MSKFAVFKHRSEAAYRLAVEDFSNQLLPLNPLDCPVVDALRREGVFVTNLSNLKLPLTTELWQGVSSILPELSSLQTADYERGEFLIKASSYSLLQHPAIFQWGLEERLITIIEHYLRLPVSYHGVYFRRDLANRVLKRTRLWHLDKEDRRMVKVIIYLNDIDAQSGCFQHIPDQFTPTINQALKYDYGTVTDKRMAQVVPASHWMSCTGVAGTVILFDPARIFHRGKTPLKADRYTLFFDYTSRIPQHPYYCKSSFSPSELMTLTARLSNRQLSCVFWNKELLHFYQRSAEKNQQN